MQLVTKFSCKLNIERNGSRLLGPKLQHLVFNVSVHEANKLFQVTLAPKASNITLPSSPYIPRRFTNKNIHKISKQCIDQGKMSITLVNYSGNVEGYMSYSNPQILTCIYIAEAPPEALLHLWEALQMGPNKRNAVEVIEERECKRKQPRSNVWNLLNIDVIRMIFSFLGGELGKYSLVSRKWMQMIGEIARVLKFKYAKDVTGDLIVRTIKRHPFLHKVLLTDCRNFQITHIKKAVSLPLRSLKSLSLENCKRISSQALYTLILQTSNLSHLNIKDSGVDDQFFMDLNPSVHLKHISSLKISGVSSQGIQHLVKKYSNLLKKLEVHTECLTSLMMFNILKLPQLMELKVYYDTIENIQAFVPNSALESIEIFPRDSYTPNGCSFMMWDSFTRCRPRHIACNLPKDCLTALFSYWPELKSVKICEFFPLPKSVSKVVMYFNDDFDNEIKRTDGEKWMGNITSFEVIMQRLEYYKTEQIKDYFRRFYPQCRVEINSI